MVGHAGLCKRSRGNNTNVSSVNPEKWHQGIVLDCPRHHVVLAMDTVPQTGSMERNTAGGKGGTNVGTGRGEHKRSSRRQSGEL